MFKRLFLTIFILLLSFTFFSYPIGGGEKYISLVKDKWLQVIQYDYNNYTIEQEIHTVSQPSFIITKSVDYTKKGYLHKIWVSSNTQLNGIMRNIKITNVSILYYDGRNWQRNFYIDFIVIGNAATQVHYFFYNNPNIEIQFKWDDTKIN